MCARSAIHSVLEVPLRPFAALVGSSGLVVLLLAAAAAFSGQLPAVAASGVVLAPLVLVAGGAIAWRFRRGRPLLGLAAVGIGLIAFQLAGIRGMMELPDGPLVFGAVVVFTAVAVPLARERATAAVYGAAGVAILGAWLIAVPIGFGFAAELAPLTASYWLAPRFVERIGLPETVIAAAALAFIFLLSWSAWRRDVVARAAAWALLAGLAAVATWRTPAAGLYATAAGAAFAAAALTEIYAVAFHDPLTGLPARRALEGALAGLHAPYVVAMVDIDHFKRFNDTHGHAAGDQVLAMVAQHLAAAPGMRAFRSGGEEFTLLVPGRSLPEALPLLEEARAAVAAAAFTLRGPDRPRRRPRADTPPKLRRSQAVTVTVSIGAAEPGEGDPPRAVLAAADQALYRAKGSGRNRVAR
ncbi:MAG: diguanylate cyclase [Gemmatimonadales bacterium]